MRAMWLPCLLEGETIPSAFLPLVIPLPGEATATLTQKGFFPLFLSFIEVRLTKIVGISGVQCDVLIYVDIGTW